MACVCTDYGVDRRLNSWRSLQQADKYAALPRNQAVLKSSGGFRDSCHILVLLISMIIYQYLQPSYTFSDLKKILNKDSKSQANEKGSVSFCEYLEPMLGIYK
jgi:hypothetical protein